MCSNNIIPEDTLDDSLFIDFYLSKCKADLVSPQSGLFDTDFVLAPYPANNSLTTATASAYLPEFDIQATFGPVKVVPGKAKEVIVFLSGEAYVMAHKGLDVTLWVRDNWGNLVSDGTPVRFAIQGHGQLIDVETATTGGRATARIVGTNLASENNQLVITVGEVTETRAFSIKPLNLEFINTLSHTNSHQNIPVSLKVTDDNGEPVVGVEVDFHSNFGRFRSGSVLTTAEGIATQRFHTGFNANARDPKVYARVGLVNAAPHSIELSNDVARGETAIDASNAMLVGDAEQSGTVRYERFDGQGLTLPYQTQTQVEISGENELMLLHLGDISEPNRAPYASYLMQELHLNKAADATGLHPASIHGVIVNQGIPEPDNTGVASSELVRVADEHPNGVGHSYHFKRKPLGSDRYAKAMLKTAAADTLKPQNSTGFRLELKPEAYDSTLFDLANGNQSLRLDESGLLIYRMTTEHGPVILRSAQPIPLHQWHKVAVRYQDGLLEMQVNSQARVSLAVSGRLDYGIAVSGLVMGDDYQGYLSSLRFYDWSTEPLLTFADGTTETRVAFTSRHTRNIQLLSTGNLNRQYEGSRLKVLTVPLIKEAERHPIGVVSKTFYASLAGYYFSQSGLGPPLVSIEDPTTNFNPAAIALMNTLVSPAHASVTDWLIDNAWDVMKEVIGYAIPYEEAIGMVQQLWYLFTGNDGFDTFELAINTVGVLTFFPPLKVIKPLIGPIQRFYRSKRNSPFMGAFADVFMTLGNDLIKGKFDKVWQLFPFILMAGEMLANDESRAALNIMVNSIASSDDLFAWTEYLAMPVDGWEGSSTQAVPQLDMFDPDSEENQTTFMNRVAPFFINSAHAATSPRRRGPSRLGVAKFTTTLRKFARTVTDSSGQPNVKAIMEGIKAVKKGMKGGLDSLSPSQRKKIRKLVFENITLGSASKLGSRLFINFMRNIRSMRMSPMTIMAIVTYLESRRLNNACPEWDTICKPFPEGFQAKIRSKYFAAFKDALLVGEKAKQRQAGALFHLAMLARKHLEYEIALSTSGDDDGKVVAIEKYYQVPLICKANQPNRFRVCNGKPRIRYSDLVLKGDEEEASDGVGPGNTLVEIKSLKGRKRSSRNTAWQIYTPPSHMDNWKKSNIHLTATADKKGGAYHRQFYLDRIMTTDNQLPGNISPDVRASLASDFEWWFHSFTSEKESGYIVTNVNRAANKLKALPDGFNGNEHASLGYSSPSGNNAYTEARIKEHLNRSDIKTWILGVGKNHLLNGFDDEFINDIINLELF